MRCFVSIEFPEHVRTEIFHSFEKLKNSGCSSGSFVSRDNLHLTLSFLGEITGEQVKKAEGILSKIDFRKFPIETGDVGFFPDRDYVKVIWVEIISKEIAPLRNEIQRALSDAGFSFKEMDFIPHLTVARINSVKDKKLFMNIVEQHKPKKMLFIAEDFALMKSNLKKTGPDYKIIKKFGMRRRE